MSILRVIGRGLAGMFKLGIAALAIGFVLNILRFPFPIDLFGFRLSSLHCSSSALCSVWLAV